MVEPMLPIQRAFVAQFLGQQEVEIEIVVLYSGRDQIQGNTAIWMLCTMDFEFIYFDDHAIFILYLQHP